MTNQPRAFFGAFAATAGVVFVLANARQPGWAVAAGVTGLLVHWKLSASADADAELADSSYFLGFLLTLVLLAAGLWSLAGARDAGNVASAAGAPNTATVLYQFLYDLAAGLSLTITGLVIRQVRTLSAPAAREPVVAAELPPSSSPPPPAISSELETILRDLALALRSRPEEAVAREVDEARARARRATEDLERGIADASPRIVASMARLEECVATTAAALMRTASAVGDSLTQTTERIDTQVGEVLKVIERERVTMSAELEQWRERLEQSHELLVCGHQSLDTEYRRGVAAVAAAGRSFTSLSQSVVQEVERMPNPAERLRSLWLGVDSLDHRLRSSIGDAGTRLAAIGEHADSTAASIDRLSESTRVAADRIERGGGDLGAALQREVRDLRKVLEEFNELLDERVKLIGAR